MTEQDFWYAVATLIYALTFFHLRKGLKNSTSWFCLLFVYLFSQNVLGYLFASLNDPFFAWIKGLPATTLHGQILVFAMLVAWTTHMLVRNKLANARLFQNLPILPVAERSVEKWLRAIVLTGAFFVVVLSLSGYLGYFIRREYLVSPPAWLDSALKLISLSRGCLFVLIASNFQTLGRTSNWTKLLIALGIIAGFFTGFKSMVVWPAILLVVGSWISASLKLKHVVLLFGVVVLAYSVVEPLRETKIQDPSLTTSDALIRVLDDDSFALMDLSSVAQQFSRRIDISTTGVQTLTALEQGSLSIYRNRLSEYFRLSPIMAFVPRAVWPDKPLANLGSVLSFSIYGHDGSSITPSVVVTTYIWGGWAGILLVYCGWGVSCTIGGQIVTKTKHQFYQSMPIILYAGVLSFASDIMASSYINILRMTVLMLMLYYSGIIRRTHRKPTRGAIR